MSTVQQSPVRIRSARTAAAAVERARLALVPTRRTQAPRAPFAALVFVILGAGVVGLLMFNTHMQQASFYATQLQQRADRLEARSQSLDLQLDQLRDPQRLAEAGRKLGMVTPGVPAFVNLADGKVVGVPTPATPQDAMRTSPLPAQLPGFLNRKPLVIRVKAPVTPPTTATGNSAQTQTPNGTASTGTGAAADRKGAATASQGA
ncbi:MAG: hypothetical protein ACJ72L_15475, partial [Marmoricola sp.]